MAKGDASQPTSMLQGLQGILGALGSMMAAPDADVPFLTGLMHVITDQIKKKTAASVAGPGASQIAPGGGGGMSGFGAGAGAPGGPMAAPGAGGMPGAGQPGQAPPPGMGAPGPGGIGAPNPDELGRVLGGVGQAS